MEGLPDLRKYWTILRRWWCLIVLCPALAGASAYFITEQRAPIYRASVLLQIRPPVGQVNLAQLDRYLNVEAPTYIEMLTERPVIEAALAQIEWEISIDELEKLAWLVEFGGMMPRASIGNVGAELVPDTRLIRLSVVDTDPERAATFANAIAITFISQYGQDQQEQYADALAAMESQMTSLAAEMENLQTQIDALGNPSTSQEQTDLILLQSALGGYRNTYSALVRDYEEMNLLAAQAANAIEIYVPARVPRSPVDPPTLRNTILAGAVGAVLAAGVAFLVEYLDDTIKTPDDVKQALGLGVLGLVGRLPDGEIELIAITQPLSPASEAFRKLRTNIRFSSLDRPLRTLLITSANPDEGKSIVSANLSAAMAQSGLKVIALDADLRRPRLDRVFDLHPRGGVTGALLDGNANGNVQPVQGTDGLFLLAAGDCPPNPAEALGSQRMRDLLEELTQQVDVVLLDSSPVLPVTDAAVLAQAVDGVLLVINAGKTRRGAARQAVQDLRQVGANLIGVVLNGVSARARGYSYRAYYGDGTRNGKNRRRKKGLLGAIRRKRERAEVSPAPEE